MDPATTLPAIDDDGFGLSERCVWQCMCMCVGESENGNMLHDWGRVEKRERWTGGMENLIGKCHLTSNTQLGILFNGRTF